MVSIECYHCGSEQLVKNGKAPNGKQKYQCRACGKASRENPDFGYSEARKEEILRAYEERLESAWFVAYLRCVT